MKRCTTVTVSIVFDDLDGQPSDHLLITALKDGLDYHGIDHEDILITSHEVENNNSNRCTCPRTCDCENPEPDTGTALVSNCCPEHNFYPSPAEDCPVHDSHPSKEVADVPVR